MIPTTQLIRISYLQGLDPANSYLQGLAGFSSVVRYESGQLLLVEGEPGQGLYYLAEGQVRLYKSSPTGREQVLQIIQAGQTFNEGPLLDGGLSSYSVQALQDCVVWHLPAQPMLDLLRQEPAVGLAIAVGLAGRLRAMSELVSDLSLRQVTGRVAKILLERADEAAISGVGISQQVTAQLTQEQMAALAGTVREVIGRALRQLERTGAIEARRGHILIKDPSRLRNFL